MDRDHVIRIILEAKDQLSGVIKNVGNTVDKEFSKIRSTFTGFNKENEQTERLFRKSLSNMDKDTATFSTKMRRSFGNLQKSITDFRAGTKKGLIDPDVIHDLVADLDKAEKAVDSRVTKIRKKINQTQQPDPNRGSLGDIFAGFSQGRKIAAETERQIRSRVALTKEEAKERKQGLEDELRIRGEALKQDSFVARETEKKARTERNTTIKEETDALKASDTLASRNLEDRLKTYVKRRREAFDQERDQREAALAVESLAIKNRVADEIFAREDQRQKDIDAVRDNAQFTKAERETEIREIKKAYRQEFRERRAERDREIRQLVVADDAIKRSRENDRDNNIRILEKTATDIRRKDSDAVKNQIKAQEASAAKINRDAEFALNQGIRQRERSFRDEAQKARSELKGQNIGNVTKEVLDQRALGFGGDTERDLTRLQQVGRKAGIAFGDFGRGLRAGRGDLREFGKELKNADTIMAKAGLSIGRFTKQIGTLVNLRWFLLVSAIQVVGHGVVVLATNLVALAASAIQAGAALGGAFAAGLAQAIPVVGLFAAVVNRVGRVMDAIQKANQTQLTRKDDQKQQLDTQRQAVQALADAHWNLKTAKEGVSEAERSLKDSILNVSSAVIDQKENIKALAEARKQAARDLVDANLEERDAALNLRDAELGILDAKERLRKEELAARGNQQDIEEAKAAVREAQARLAIAQKEGDQAEISKANQQLNLAKQNLTDINNQQTVSNTALKEAHLSVKQAQLNRDQAEVRNKRAREDAKKARKEGVDGNQSVISAQRQVVSGAKAVQDAQHGVVLQHRAVRDASHAVAIAHREERDAQLKVTETAGKQTAAQKALQQQLADLSPAERGLFKSFKRIQDIYRKNARPITDIIIRSLTVATDRAATLLQNPKVLGAFRRLATGIGKSIRELSRFFTSKGFIDRFAFFIDNAAKNVPHITHLIESLTTAFLDLAKAGTPLFNNLLRRLDKFGGKISDFTEQKGRRPLAADAGGGTVRQGKSPLERGLAAATEHLNAWINLAKAIGRIVFYLTRGAGDAGKGLVGDITRFFNRIADFLRDNPKKVNQFFQNMRKQFLVLSSLAGNLGRILFKAFSSDEAGAFTELIVKTVVPGLVLLLQTLGIVSKVLLGVFKIPIIGQFAQLALQVLVAEKALNRIFPVTQKLTNGLKKGAAFFIGELATGFAKTRFQIAKFVIIIRTVVIPALAELGAALLANPIFLIAAAVVAIGIALFFLDRKFHFIAPTIKFIGKLLHDVFDWAKAHWKLLLAILLGPFTLVAYAIIKWRDQIIGFFDYIIKWVEKHWKLLVTILLGPFLIGGAIILGIIRWKDKLLGIFKNLTDDMVGFFKKLPNRIVDALKGLPKLILRLFKDLGKEIADQIFSFLPKPIRAAVNKAIGFGKKVIGGAKDKVSDVFHGRFAMGGEVGGSSVTGKAVPIIAHAGEWVLNKMQQSKLAGKLNRTTSQVKNWLFGTNMPGEPGAATKSKQSGKPITFPGWSYHLVPHVDSDGNQLWFLEFDDGTYGGVTPRDARKIISTHGNWIPGYVKRSQHSFTQQLTGIDPGVMSALGKKMKTTRAFASGGVVPSFEMGGMVPSAMKGPSINNSGGNKTSHKTVHQNLNVNKVEGETDWNYVMRLMGIHAQEGF